MKFKFDCVHVETCLPDYWPGHRIAHVAIPVFKGMGLIDIKECLKAELKLGAIAGSNDDAFLLSGFEGSENSEKCFKAAIAAINRIKPQQKGKRKFFMDLQEEEDYCIYAYFVFYPLVD